MKTFLATTAIALVMANGAFAESHVNADGTSTDTTMSTDSTTTTGAPADTTTSTDANTTTSTDANTTTSTDAGATQSTDTGAAATQEPAAEAATDSTTSTDTTMSADPAADPAMTDSMTNTTATEMTDQTGVTDATSTTDAMAATTDLTAPAKMMDGYTTIANMDVTAEELTGVEVYGTDDSRVGEIGDLVVGSDGMITEVIVDVGGFLGMGEKPVALAFNSVQIMKQTDGTDMRAYVSMTEAQLKDLPKYEAPAADRKSVV